jgi:hypothetical protein
MVRWFLQAHTTVVTLESCEFLLHRATGTFQQATMAMDMCMKDGDIFRCHV